VAAARADVDAAQAGPTAEQRAIANAQVQAAAATVAVLERRFDKTMVRAPADGIVTVRPRSSQARRPLCLAEGGSYLMDTSAIAARGGHGGCHRRTDIRSRDMADPADAGGRAAARAALVLRQNLYEFMEFTSSDGNWLDTAALLASSTSMTLPSGCRRSADPADPGTGIMD
jgi:hypothetical protein